MSEQQETYIRLPGRAQRHGGPSVLAAERYRLWLGSDHLLHVTGTRYRETYKRFYFRDIQALSLRKTRTGAVWSIVLGSLAAPLLAVALSVEIRAGEYFRGVGMVLFGAPGALCLLLLLFNMAFGPTCICHLRTAVHVEELPCLGRLRTAERVFDRLKVIIEEVQGRVQPEMTQRRPPEMVMLPGPKLAKPPPAVRHSTARAHEILLYLLFIDLIPTALARVFPDNQQLGSLQYMTFTGVLGCSIAAAVIQRSTDIPRSIKSIPWILIGYAVARTLIGVGQSFTIFVQMVGQGKAPFEALPRHIESFEASPLFLGLTIIGVLLHVTLGSVGVVLLRDFRRRSRRSSPVSMEAPPGGGGNL